MSPFTKARHDVVVGRNAMTFMTGLKEFNQDSITVAMECDHYIAVARAGADGKLVHVISM